MGDRTLTDFGKAVQPLRYKLRPQSSARNPVRFGERVRQISRPDIRVLLGVTPEIRDRFARCAQLQSARVTQSPARHFSRGYRTIRPFRRVYEEQIPDRGSRGFHRAT